MSKYCNAAFVTYILKRDLTHFKLLSKKVSILGTSAHLCIGYNYFSNESYFRNIPFKHR